MLAFTTWFPFQAGLPDADCGRDDRQMAEVESCWSSQCIGCSYPQRNSLVTISAVPFHFTLTGSDPLELMSASSYESGQQVHDRRRGHGVPLSFSRHSSVEKEEAKLSLSVRDPVMSLMIRRQP